MNYNDDWEKRRQDEAREERRERRNGLIKIVVALGIIIGLVGWAISLGVGAYFNSIAFDRAVGDKFELADSASNAYVKTAYFDQFVQSVQSNGLTSGQTNLWQQTPRTDLTNIWNVTLSLQTQLHNLEATCKQNGNQSFACSSLLQEISITEFCWFPIDVYRAGWDMQHGYGSFHAFRTDQANRCASAKS